ncbi:MAG TPA: hypothetical protein VJX67_20795 [Blastocatellia bacterium]|nr:hypothetical protein [Blastocatellia bacterium]
MSTKKTRLRFDKALVKPDGQRLCRVETTFSFGGQQILTAAIDSEDRDGPLRAAAAATLEAIKQAVSDRFACTLEDLDRVNALGKDLIAVLVNVDFEGRSFQLFGSCQISGDEVATAVKATLNATNRFVDLAMRG